MTKELFKNLDLRRLCIQFLRYLGSGGAAAVLTVLSYALFIHIGIEYVIATPISDIVGLLCTFFFHKYFVFGKKERIIPHAFRYAVLQILNTIVQTVFVYLCVQYLGMDKVLARILSIAFCVPVNFFAYKYFVYI